MIRNIIREAVRLAVRPVVGQSWASYLQSQSSLQFIPRSRLDLIENFSGLNLPAKILTPTYMRGDSGYIAGDKTRSSELVFDGNDYTFYLKFDLLVDIVAANIDADGHLIIAGGSVGTARGIDILGYTGGLRAIISDGTTRYLLEVIPYHTINALMKGKGTYELLCQVDYTNKLFKCSIYDSDGATIGNVISQDISTFVFNSNQNNAAYSFNSSKFAVSHFKKFSGLKTLLQCQTDSYVMGLQIHIPLLINGTDVSGNNQHFTPLSMVITNKQYMSHSSWLLDYGFTIYKRTGYLDFYIPNDVNGNEITRTITNYTKSGNMISGDLTAHNMLDSIIEFNSTGSLDSRLEIFDRSNTTRQTDLSRASSYYNATSLATKSRYHITEISDPRIYFPFFNVDYKGLIFSKIQSVAGVITKYYGQYCFKTDQKMKHEWDIFQAFGLDAFAVLDEGGSWTYDENGYIIIT